MNCEACGAPVIWVANDKTGKVAPIDLRPDPAGNILLNWSAGRPMAPPTSYTVLGKPDAVTPSLFEDDTRPRYTSHFATCPNADHYRRRCSKCRHNPCTCPR